MPSARSDSACFCSQEEEWLLGLLGKVDPLAAEAAATIRNDEDDESLEASEGVQNEHPRPHKETKGQCGTEYEGNEAAERAMVARDPNVKTSMSQQLRSLLTQDSSSESSEDEDFT